MDRRSWSSVCLPNSIKLSDGRQPWLLVLGTVIRALAGSTWITWNLHWQADPTFMKMLQIMGETYSAAAACVTCSNKSSLIWFHDSVGSCISNVLADRKLFCRSFVETFGSGAYVVSASLGKSISIWWIHSLILRQFSSLVDWPALESGASTSISWILKSAVNGLSSNISWTLDAGPACSTQNPRTTNAFCDEQHQRGSLAQWIKISLKCPNVSLCFAREELDYSVGST